MTTPDPTLAARLDYLCSRYVTTQDTPLMWEAERIMFHAYRSGQLITTAEADARVKAAVLAEREAAKSMVWTLGHEIKASMLVDEDNERAVLDMVKATAAAIRSRGVTG